MNNFSQQQKKLLAGLFLISCLPFASSKAATHPQQEQADVVINQLYHSLNKLPKSDMSARIDSISAKFIGKKYRLGALGEGIDAHYDQRPQYRADAFDCDTYVTTVLALALADNTNGFKQCLRKVRYKDGKVSFLKRNHFMSLDWNPNNQKQGFIKDITMNIKNKDNQPVAEMAEAMIDKPSWYNHFQEDDIRLISANPQIQKIRLSELKQRGMQLEKTLAKIPYIPLTALFNAKGEANKALFAQIPNASIIEIVRPNWDLQDKIGTHLNVSHLGFAFRKNNKLYFRQASSEYNQVVEVPLEDYLRKCMESPTIKGINVEIILPKKPLQEGCVV